MSIRVESGYPRLLWPPMRTPRSRGGCGVVIGVDPAGRAARFHSSLHGLKLRRGYNSSVGIRVRRGWTYVACLGVCSASILVGGQLASGYEPVTHEFQISESGGPDNPERLATFSGVAHNPNENQYLVTWAGDGLATDGDWEIFGQLLRADGQEIGPEFAISDTGPEGEAGWGVAGGDVVFNRELGEYMVVWTGEGTGTENETEVFGQRLTASGVKVGSAFRVSNVDVPGAPFAGAGIPSIALNATDDEYLVTWHAAASSDGERGEHEIYGQRINAEGAELGGDFRISHTGTDGDETRDAAFSKVAYSPDADEYFVTWYSDGLATEDEHEIFGQRITSDGQAAGPEIRISHVGRDGDASRDGLLPSIAYNGVADEYLIVWHADALRTDNEFEIFGQRISASGQELGPVIRVSSAGRDDDPNAMARNPNVAFNRQEGEFLVVWVNFAGAPANDEEIFGQRINAAGEEIQGDFQISESGTAGQEFERAGGGPEPVYNQSSDEFLVTWQESFDAAGGVDDIEVMGRLLMPEAPTAVDDSKTVAEDDPATTINVLANDTDPDGGPKTINSKTNGAHGAVAITNSGADLTYTPAPDYCGPDSFTYTLNGGSTATVSITVSCVDASPTAVEDSKTVAEDDPATTINVLANDTDPDGGPKTINSKTNGTHGTVAITNSGADLTYTPDADYCGSDSFTYTLNGGSAATVNVTVTCIDDPPTAVNDSKTVSEGDPATTINVLANDTDPDGGPKTITAKTNGAHGTVAITNSVADLTYTPAPDYCGPDSFTYTINGGSTATVSITVSCVDDEAPQTIVDKATVAQKKRLAKFTFSSNEAGSTFTCKIDKKAFKHCDSPKVFKKLKSGKHKFKVIATDKAGNADPTPAIAKFRIKN